MAARPEGREREPRSAALKGELGSQVLELCSVRHTPFQSPAQLLGEDARVHLIDLFKKTKKKNTKLLSSKSPSRP